MSINQIILIGYGVFLAIILIINLLYFFQVFKYRLPGDASLPILAIYLLIIVTIVLGTDFLLRLWQA